jgi:hypothetical protein
MATAPIRRRYQPPLVEAPLTASGDFAQVWQAHFQQVADSLDADTAVQKSGGTMTGLLVLSGVPAVPLGAATKGYVDGLIAGLNTRVTALEAVGAALAAGASYANDAAAAAGGVAIGKYYRNGSVVMVRVA